MAGSIIMVTLIQTVMLSERVPVLLTRLVVTDTSLSLALMFAVSNSMVTGAIQGKITNNYNQFRPSKCSHKTL